MSVEGMTGAAAELVLWSLHDLGEFYDHLDECVHDDDRTWAEVEAAAARVEVMAARIKALAEGLSVARVEWTGEPF